MSAAEEPAGRGGRSTGRSIAAVLFGFLVMSVVVVLFDVVAGGGNGEAAPPDSEDLRVRIRLFVDVVAATAGGYAAAWIAPGRPIVHAGALAVVVGLLGVTSALVYLGQQPLTYSILLVVLVIPAVLLGGWLRARRAGARSG